MVREAVNNLPNVQPIMQDEHGNIVPNESLDMSASYTFENDDSPKKKKKVGYYKAKITNLMKTGVFKQKKNNARDVKNIMEIEQLMDDTPAFNSS